MGCNDISTLMETLGKMKDADEEAEKERQREEELEIERKRLLKEEREAKKEFEAAERKRLDKLMNESTRPWINEGRAYSDKEYELVIEGDSDDETDCIKIGKKLGRKATAIRFQRELRNRYLKSGRMPTNLWGQSKSNGPHDLEDKPDHNGRQLKKIIDEMPDYYRRFT